MKINTKTLDHYFKSNAPVEMKEFVRECVSNFLEFSDITDTTLKVNPAKLNLLRDLKLVIED